VVDRPGGRIDLTNYFSVNVDGRPCRYIGFMKKRGNPTAADYIAVKPGESLTSVVSLSEAYAISGPDLLTVAYSAINPGLAEDAPGDQSRFGHGIGSP
jgi:peptidyl-Lys metalloendopeptidase